MEIIFKNVGQGDSIILKWLEDKVYKYGLIDCNIFNGENPVLEYIKKENIEEIDFIFLSHPHHDHFSGFLELLKYCKENDIFIRNFLHTSENTPDYLKTAVTSISIEKDLLELFAFLRVMRDEHGMGVYSIDDNPNFVKTLDSGFKMEVLAPSSTEKDKYIRGQKYPFDEEEASNNPNANWLCTVIKIHNENCSVLLTSDAEKSVLTRLGKRKSGRIDNKIILCQAPHHGSKGNLNRDFWRLRKRYEDTPTIISVGKNGYKHPSKEVIDFFEKTPNYNIYSTNKEGALLSESSSDDENTMLLNLFSKKVGSGNNKSKFEGDHTFKLSKKGITKI